MKSENLVELKRLRDIVAAARTALANLGSPVEHWDHIIVFIMFMKFSPETRREWNKTLGKSREYASYEQIYDFLPSILMDFTARDYGSIGRLLRPSVWQVSHFR